MDTEQSQQYVNPPRRGGQDSKRIRKPKDGNSQLFNEILSASNALSVSERTRLVKSLAGQLSMVVVGAGELIKKPDNPAASKVASVAKPIGSSVRPNPLKGTKFEHDKEIAYKALVEAKKALKEGEKLPPDDIRVVNYNNALRAYKDEHARLKPVDNSGTAVVTTNDVQNQPKAKKTRTTTDRSPPPPVGGRNSFTKGLIGSLQKLTKMTTTTSGSSDNHSMEEEEGTGLL